MRGKIVVLVLVGLAFAGGASAASSRRHVCRRPARARVLASNRRAVLYSRRGGRVYGCLKARGVTRLLLGAAYDFDALVAVRLAGRFAVLEPEYSNQYATGEDVTLYDLGSGKATDLADVAWGPSADPNVERLDFLALDSSGFAAWRKTVSPGAVSITAISCPSASLCVAGDDKDNILTSTDPTGGASTWTTSKIGTGRGAPLNAVSCPSVSLCVAGDSDGDILASTDPTGGAGAWTKTKIATSLSGAWLNGVSCPSVSLCVAGDSDGHIFTSTDPTGRASAWTKTKIDTGRGASLQAVSCPSVSLCVVVDAAGNALTSTDPTGGASTWTKTKTSIDSAGLVVDMSCPSVSLCVAVDWDGGNIVTSTDPKGGAGAWTKTKIVTALGADLNAVSCPSVSLCVAGDQNGNIFSSTDPTGGANTWTPAAVDIPGCAPQPFPCISEQLYAHDDQSTRVIDAALSGQGNSIGNVALASRVLSWTHDGAQRQLQLR